MIMAIQSADAFVIIICIPHFDSQISGTRYEMVSLCIKCDILHCLCVALERSFILTRLIVPNLDGGVFGCRSKYLIDGMKYNACNRTTVAH